MGETILANSEEQPPDILLTAVKAFKRHTKQVSQRILRRAGFSPRGGD